MRLRILLHAPIECGCFFAYSFTDVRHAAIGVAFAQHRIHGAAQHLRVARLDRLLRVVLRIFRIVGNRVALLLQFLDRGLQLRHRRADVRQLDDVGVGRLGEFAEFCQVVGLALRRAGRDSGKLRQDAPGQRDVAGLDGDAGGAREACTIGSSE